MNNNRTVSFVALGCAKNLVDSEKMLGQLAEAGAIICATGEPADVVVINTCGFLSESRDEAHEIIAEMVDAKREGLIGRIVVAGCLVQRDGLALLDAFPEIDALVGVHERDQVVRAALEGQLQPDDQPDKPRHAPSRRKRDQHHDLYLSEYHPHVYQDTGRLRLTPAHFAYLRISEGCDQSCTFCTIPSIRGPMRSKPPEAVLAEASELIADGVQELNLIAQDTTAYGRDIDYQPGLAGLLHQLDELPGVHWLRLLYAYPTSFTDEMIQAMADCRHVVPYLDIPLQHISDHILRSMGRRVTRQQTEQLLHALHEAVPNIAIRTTLIAGFPGETEDDFQELLSFIKQFRFAALGVFPFSPEPDTPAAKMKNQVAPEERLARGRAILETQQQIAFEMAESHVGQQFQVLIEQQAENGEFQARNARQAPEVDPVTFVQATDLTPGSWLNVTCQGRREYDLIARPADAILPQTTG